MSRWPWSSWTDNFKGINDSMGHSAGDAVLKQVAGRIETCVRPGDTVARLGGDEFAVLLEGISDVTDAQACADRSLSSKDILICGSMGIASTHSGDEQTASVLLQQADTAMYVAKSKGRRHCLFNRSMQSSLMEPLELLADFPRHWSGGNSCCSISRWSF
jgi:diguanylate cyclase (GGDEF)-like protein